MPLSTNQIAQDPYTQLAKVAKGRIITLRSDYVILSFSALNGPLAKKMVILQTLALGHVDQ